MSKTFSIELWLEIGCNRENVSKIIQRALNDNAIFYSKASAISLGPSLPLDLILDRIFNNSQDKQDFEPCISMHYKNEWFSICFYSKSGMEIYVGFQGVPLHMNKDDGGERIDFDYYIRMLLDLLKDFPITALKCIKDLNF